MSEPGAVATGFFEMGNKPLSIFCILVSLTLCVVGQQKYECRNQHEVEEIGYEKARGPVEFFNVEVETLVSQGHVIFTNPGKPYLFATYKYDAAGRLSEKNFYRMDGVAMPKTVFIYDTNGALLKEQHYSAVSKAPYLETVFTYENGLLKDSVGSNVEKPDGFLSRKEFFYKPERRYFEFLETKGYPSPTVKVGFVQDEKCRFSEVFAFAKDGTLASRSVFTFDNFDNPVLAESFFANGKLAGKSKNEYEYDSYQNWIKQSQSLWNAQTSKWVLQEIVYRKITYRSSKKS